jgi:hypothetical protein
MFHCVTYTHMENEILCLRYHSQSTPTCTCTCTCKHFQQHSDHFSLLYIHNPSAGATSTGLSIKVLQKCAAYSTGSALVLLSAPPTPPGGRGGLFGAQGGSSSKALCYNICFSVQTGKSLGQVELLPSNQLHCALTKGASMMAMGKFRTIM